MPRASDTNAHLTQLLLAAQMMLPLLCFPTTAMPQALPVPALTAAVAGMPPAGLQGMAQPAACCGSHPHFQARPILWSTPYSVGRAFSRPVLPVLEITPASSCSCKGLNLKLT